MKPQAYLYAAYVAIIGLCQTACETASISLEQQATEIQAIVPEPEAWSYERFRHEWLLAETDEDRSQILSNLSERASLNFDWSAFWNGFRRSELSWPPHDSKTHAVLLAFGSSDCRGDSRRSFALAVLNFVKAKSKPEELKLFYYDAAFGIDDSCHFAHDADVTTQAVNWLLAEAGTDDKDQYHERLILAIKRLHQARVLSPYLSGQGEPLNTEAIDRYATAALAEGKIDKTLEVFSGLQKLAALDSSSREAASLIEKRLFGGPSTLAKTLDHCRALSSCDPAGVIQSLDEQDDSFFISFSISDVEAILKILSKESEHSASSHQGLEGGRAFLFEANRLLRIGDRLTRIYRHSLNAEIFKFTTDVDGAIARYLFNLQVLERHALAEWLYEVMKNENNYFYRMQTFRLNPKMFNWKIHFNSHSHPTTNSESIFYHRLANTEPDLDRSTLKARQKEWCRFLENAGHPTKIIETFDQLLSHFQVSNEKAYLPPGCYKWPWQAERSDQLLVLEFQSLEFSPDSYLILPAMSVDLSASKIINSRMDLSSPTRREQLAHPSIAEAESLTEEDLQQLVTPSFNAMIFPIMFSIEVPKDDNNTDPLDRPECQVHDNIDNDGLSPRGYRGVGKNTVFCPGEHVVGFHLPWRYAIPAPEIKLTPDKALSGGNLIHPKEADVRFPLVLYSRPEEGARPGFAGLAGGQGDESFSLSIFGKEEQNGLVNLQNLGRYPNGHGFEPHPYYVHTRLEASQVFALFRQGKKNEDGMVIEVDEDFAKYLDPRDRQKLNLLTNGHPEDASNLILSSSEHIEKMIIDVVNTHLKTWHLNEPSLTSTEKKVVEEVNAGQRDFFDMQGKVRLRGLPNGSNGPDGEEGHFGRILER